MIHLEPVNESTFKKVVDMRLPDEQNRFVAPNVVSLAQAWLYRDEARPYAVLCGDEPVGFIMLDWDENERTCGIWRFMIAKDHQRKGYGKAALEAAVELARSAGVFDLIHLDYVPGNDTARRLYLALGFRENGDIEDGEIVMTLPLTDEPRVGMLTADGEDLEDFLDLIDEIVQSGADIPDEFSDKEQLEAALLRGEVTRFTLMGETIGLAISGVLLIGKEYTPYRDEAQGRLSAAD